MIKICLSGSGWALVKDTGSPNALLELAHSLGQPIAPDKRRIVQQLLARESREAPINTYTGMYGLGAFPFHTDMANWTIPPRYVLLRHYRGNLLPPTFLLDSRILLSDVNQEALSRGIWLARALSRSFVVNIISQKQGKVIFRWDGAFLRPITREAKGAHCEMLELIREKAQQHLTPIYYESSSILIIDNWRILHSRPALQPDETDRVLERVLVI
jgi:hypothetical protein